ncbi:MAG: electron transfer flavoprotein subunit beta/FixA family protein [Pseudomonadota bacterium]
MRVLVCLKQVCEPQSQFDLDGAGLRLRGPARYKLAAYDEYALELGLRLRDAQPGLAVWAVTVGPARAAAVLQRARGMGADRAWRLLAPEEPAPRPGLLAAWLAAWAKAQGFDLILTGVMSEDAQQGLVGPMLAARLDIPWATGAVGLTLATGGGAVKVEREMEGNQRQSLELPLPALVSVQSSPQQPRYPSLSNLLKAKQEPATSLDVADLAAPAATEQITGLGLPRRRRAGLVLTGSRTEQAARLAGILRERALL